MPDRTIEDVDDYARLAVRECARLRLDLSSLRERVAELESELEQRLDQARDSLSRQTMPSDERLERLVEAIERRIQERSSPPPDSSAEVKTPGGTRVRAPWWLALVLALVLLLIAAIWRVEELAKALALR